MSTAHPMQIVVSRPMAMPGDDASRLLAIAAAGAEPASADPVDRAAIRAAAEAGEPVHLSAASYAAPQAGRRYSLSEVNGVSSEGALRVARGDFNSVLSLCAPDAEGRSAARHLAERCRDAGFRPWAIATAPAAGGSWAFRGVIPVRAAGQARAIDRANYVFVKIWSFLLRFLHWSWALLILILIATGLEIQTMYLSAGTTRTDTGFFFGYVRLVHYICGWLLAAAVLARFADALFTRNRFENWRALIPLKSLRDVKGLFHEIGNYALLRNDEGKKYLGHDPLAQLSFTFIYLVMIAIIGSGLAIYGLYDPENWFFSLFQWPIRMFGANEVRLFHVTMMWLIILFVPLHVYLVIRADGYAREGSLSSMLSGGRWIRRGARFEDAPDPEAVDLRIRG